MADKTKFMGDFRSAVTQLLNAADQLDSLVGMCEDLGWGALDFPVGGDITNVEFYTAITTWKNVSTSLETSVSALTKLKP